MPISLWPLFKIQAHCHVHLLSFDTSIEGSKVLSQRLSGVDLSLYIPNFLPLECSRKLKQYEALLSSDTSNLLMNPGVDTSLETKN